MTEEVDLGTLVGKIRFELPPEEAKKLDMSTYSGKLNPSMKLPAGASGGSGGETAADFKEEGKGLFEGAEKSKIGKSLLGLTPMLTLIGGIVGFLAASGGLRQLLGAFFDIIGLIADLLFVTIFPILEPLLKGFVQIAKLLVEKSSGPGGIFGALLDPSFFQAVALLLITALLEVSAEIIKLFANILEGAAQMLTSDGGTFATDMGELFGNAAGAMIDVITSLLLVWTGWIHIGTAILNSMTDWIRDPKGKAGAMFSGFATGFAGAIKDNIDAFKSALKGLFDATGDFFVALCKFFAAVFEAIFETWIKIGEWVAEGFQNYIVSKVPGPMGDALEVITTPAGRRGAVGVAAGVVNNMKGGGGRDGKWYTPW